MNVLITGSNGLLGQKLIHKIPTESNNVYGCDLASATVVKDVDHQYVMLDLYNRKDTVDLIVDIKPNVIVHAGAMTNVDLCETEKENCWRVNVSGTEHVILGADKVGASVIFLSTDYIFNGANGPYTENDFPDPKSYYGRSKLAAENAFRGSRINWTIVRTNVLYGHSLSGGHSYLSWLLRSLRSGEQVRIVNDQLSNPTFVDDLAIGIESIIKRDYNGIINIAGAENFSRYEFSCRIADYFKLDKGLIIPIKTADLNLPAERPLRSGLLTNKAEEYLGYYPTAVENTLEIYQNQVS
jgi:dTDP-4-dehydrorhamnose reductase